MKDKSKSDIKLVALGAALALAIMVLDFRSPQGVAGGAPYVALPLICLWASNRRLCIYAAVVGSALTVFGYYFSAPGVAVWVEFANRALALFAIWITAALVMERKKYELAIEFSLAQQNATLESTADGILVIDNQDKVLSYNANLKSMLKIPDEIIESSSGVGVLSFIRGRLENSDAFRDTDESWTSEKPEEPEILEVTGGQKFVMTINPLRIEGVRSGKVYCFSDMTAFIEAETELKKAKEELEVKVRERTAELSKLSHALQHSPSVVCITSRDGAIEYVNKRFCEVTGYAPEEAMGKNPSILRGDNLTDDDYKQMWDTILLGSK